MSCCITFLCINVTRMLCLCVYVHTCVLAVCAWLYLSVRVWCVFLSMVLTCKQRNVSHNNETTIFMLIKWKPKKKKKKLACIQLDTWKLQDFNKYKHFRNFVDNNHEAEVSISLIVQLAIGVVKTSPVASSSSDFLQKCTCMTLSDLFSRNAGPLSSSCYLTISTVSEEVPCHLWKCSRDMANNFLFNGKSVVLAHFSMVVSTFQCLIYTWCTRTALTKLKDRV